MVLLIFGGMAEFNDYDRDIAVDIIADKINEAIDRRPDSLHSIDVLTMAVELIDSFDTIFSFILHATEMAIICKKIVSKLNEAGVPVDAEDVKEVMNTIADKPGRPRPNS